MNARPSRLEVPRTYTKHTNVHKQHTHVLHVCMYTHTHTHTHIHKLYTCVQARTHMYTNTHVHTHTHIQHSTLNNPQLIWFGKTPCQSASDKKLTRTSANCQSKFSHKKCIPATILLPTHPRQQDGSGTITKEGDNWAEKLCRKNSQFGQLHCGT